MTWASFLATCVHKCDTDIKIETKMSLSTLNHQPKEVVFFNLICWIQPKWIPVGCRGFLPLLPLSCCQGWTGSSWMPDTVPVGWWLRSTGYGRLWVFPATIKLFCLLWLSLFPLLWLEYVTFLWSFYWSRVMALQTCRCFVGVQKIWLVFHVSFEIIFDLFMYSNTFGCSYTLLWGLWSQQEWQVLKSLV